MEAHGPAAGLLHGIALGAKDGLATGGLLAAEQAVHLCHRAVDGRLGGRRDLAELVVGEAGVLGGEGARGLLLARHGDGALEAGVR